MPRQAALRARRRGERAANAVRGRSRQAGQGAYERPHRDPGIPELAARWRRRAGRWRQVGRDLDGPSRLRVTRQDRVRNRRVQHAVCLSRCGAQPARHGRAHLACAAEGQSGAGREGQHANRRKLLPGHARVDVQGEGPVAQGYARQEVSRRADQALVVDAYRNGRRRDAGRSLGTRHRTCHGACRRAGKPAAEHLHPEALRGAEVRDDDRTTCNRSCRCSSTRTCGKAIPAADRKIMEDTMAEVGQARRWTGIARPAAKYRKDLEGRAWCSSRKRTASTSRRFARPC